MTVSEVQVAGGRALSKQGHYSRESVTLRRKNNLIKLFFNCGNKVNNNDADEE